MFYTLIKREFLTSQSARRVLLYLYYNEESIQMDIIFCFQRNRASIYLYLVSQQQLNFRSYLEGSVWQNS